MSYRTVSDGHHALAWVAIITGVTSAIGGCALLIDPSGIKMGVDGMYPHMGIADLTPMAVGALVLAGLCALLAIGAKRDWAVTPVLGAFVGSVLLVIVVVQSYRIGFGYPPQVFVAIMGGSSLSLSGAVLASQIRDRRKAHTHIVNPSPATPTKQHVGALTHEPVS